MGINIATLCLWLPSTANMCNFWSWSTLFQVTLFVMIHVIAFLSKEVEPQSCSLIVYYMKMETSTGWFQNWFYDINESSWSYHRIDTKFMASQMGHRLTKGTLQHLALRGLFGKFVEFGHKLFKYRYTPFMFWYTTGGHYRISIP